MNEMRSNGLWILSLNAAVASYIYKCVQCRHQRRPTEGQKMANLPEDRVESDRPLHSVEWIVLDHSRLRKEGKS